MDIMTVWTIQDLPAWEHFKREKVFSGQVTHIYSDYLSAYEWMRRQMVKRLVHYQGGWPVWLWVRWNSAFSRPDLRATGHLPAGTQGVRLELHVPRHEVLVSDFEQWHCVLNNQYLGLSELEDEIWHQRAAAGQVALSVLQQEREASWERIFDFVTPRDLEWAHTVDESAMQGCIERIHLDHVVTVTPFTARGSK